MPEVTQELSIPMFFAHEGFLGATVVICICCFYYCIIRGQTKMLQNKLFLSMVGITLVDAVCNLISNFAKMHIGEADVWHYILTVPQFIYFLLHACLAALFCFYVSVVTGAYHSLRKKYRFVYQLPMYATLLLIVTNPLTHIIYSFDEQGGYHRGPGHKLLYIVAAFYFIFSTAMLFVFWKALNLKLRRVMRFFFVVVFIALFLQMIFVNLRIELFGQAVGLCGVMIVLEGEEGRKDPRTGIYNHAALSYDVNRNMRVRKSFFLICLKMVNPSSMMQMIGPVNIEKLTEMTGQFLTTLVPKHNIYYIGTGTFVIITDDNDREHNIEIARAINERYKKPWSFLERDTVFSAIVYCAEIPNDLKTYKDVSTLINSPAFIKGNDSRDIYYGKSLSFIMRRGQVENAVMKGFQKRSFEVYYQPIYNAKDKTICSGEALIRLHNDELGDIYPDEFLPIIEKGGLIFELGDFVLEEVCKFLSSGIPMEMGVDSLNINLSAVQCMQTNYAERIIQIVSKYNISPSNLNFEITEYIAGIDFNIIRQFVKKLTDYGFHFSMDDYGTGYSNIQALFSLDLNVVKIDRTILWDAEQSENGRIVMESTIGMIRRMNKKILVSGVENKQQLDLLKDFEIDYLQGFYFSNPLNQNEFISILKATQLAKIEEQKALAASESMSNFLANMSHEIRTPINAVLGMDELIIRESGDEKITEYAKVIEGAGKTLLSLINDILDFSKIEAGNMEIVEAPYELSSTVMDVVNMVSIKAKQKGLALLLDTDSSTPEHLLGDEMRIKQVMLNVINNAIKYTENGSVTLKITHEPIDVKKENIIISVRDTGIGIKEEDIDKLFEKFHRLDLDKNKTIEGSGLGLAITKRIITAMNGDISVESVYGSGSTFTIRIPQVLMTDTAIGNLKGKITHSDKSDVLDHQKFICPDAKILVIDDTPVNHMVVRELLKNTKVQIDEATSGEEGLQYANEKKYDLILLDYRMPIMDGIQTLKKLKENKQGINYHTTVIALTANAIAGARSRFINEGFDDYITKPVDSGRLEDAMLMYIPSSKIQMIGSDVSKETESNSQQRTNQPEYDNIETEGIKNCGSKESYEKVFAAFQNEIPNRVGIITESLENGDYERYAIEVHSIKSSARIIGAKKLSLSAERLESAANEKNIDYIRENNEELLEMYKKFCKHCKNNQADDTKKPVLDEKVWKDGLETFRDFASSMDYDNANDLILQVHKYRLTPEMQEMVDKLESLAYDLKWDEIVELIDSKSSDDTK